MEYIKRMVRLELYAILAENASTILKIFRQVSTKYDNSLVFLLFIWYHVENSPQFAADSGAGVGKV